MKRIKGYVVIWDGIVMRLNRGVLFNWSNLRGTVFPDRAAASRAIEKSLVYWAERTSASREYHITPVESDR